MGEYVSKIQRSLGALHQAGIESIIIGRYHLDVVEIINKDNSSIHLTMPSPITIDIINHYAERYSKP
jgi:hypothetical protein